MQNKVVLIDPGHGAETLGKRSPDETLCEYEFNRDVARRLHKILVSAGVDARLTVTDDKDMPLIKRTNQAKELKVKGYEVFLISIHANAFGSGWNSAHGIETFTNNQAQQLAEKIQTSLIRATGLTNRGVKHADLHITREAAKAGIPACLVELGFMTNKEESELLKTHSCRAKCANAIASAICEYYGYKYPQLTDKPVDNLPCNISWNNQLTNLKGVIRDDKSYLPVRGLVELIGNGHMIDWCNDTKKVILDGHVLQSTLVLGGIGYGWVREIAEVLELKVEWEEATKTVKLKG